MEAVLEQLCAVVVGVRRGAAVRPSAKDSGGTTCLTLLVSHMFSANVANNAANSVN